MVDGNVWVQCMMGNVVHGWCAVWVSGNQIHNRAPHLGAASRRLHKAKSRRAVERRWNRGRGRRTRSMWGQWNRSPPGQGGRDSRDVRWLWQVSGGVRWLWQVSGGVRWLWQVSGGVRWLWQVSGGVRWLWQVSGGVRWLWQVSGGVRWLWQVSGGVRWLWQVSGGVRWLWQVSGGVRWLWQVSGGVRWLWQVSGGVRWLWQVSGGVRWLWQVSGGVRWLWQVSGGVRWLWQSHLTPPLTCQSHLTPPLTCQSHLTPPLTCQSHLTPPLTCQSHLTPPLTCQSHLTPPLTCQSHLTPPLTCQSHLTPPLTCQSHLTPPLTCQSHLTSLLSRPPCPGGLLFHWPHMDLVLRPLPRFHLRSTALLDFALCKRLEAAPRWGALLWIWFPLTQTAHHPWTTFPIMHCTHTFPSTITPITQLSPFTHQLWLPHHTCTSFSHSHKSSTQTLTHCEVLFSPGYISERSPIHPAISVFHPGLPDLGSLNLCLWPRLLPGIVYVSALPLIFLFLPADPACLILPIKYCCTWIPCLWPVFTLIGLNGWIFNTGWKSYTTVSDHRELYVSPGQRNTFEASKPIQMKIHHAFFDQILLHCGHGPVRRRARAHLNIASARECNYATWGWKAEPWLFVLTV